MRKKYLKLAIFYRIPHFLVVGMLGSFAVNKAVSLFLSFFNIIGLLGRFYSVIFNLVFFILWITAFIVTIKQQYYKHQTGRNLYDDQRQLHLSYNELLRRFRAEKIDKNPPVPKELLHKIPNGFFFGKFENNYVVKPQCLDGSCLVIGGAGTGKSSCIAIPTIKTWNTSIFSIDIKGELSRKGLSEEQRKKTKILAPADPNSNVGFDPFYLVNKTTNPVQAVREIAIALIEKPENIKDPFWINGSQNIFTGAMLYGISRKMNFILIVKWLLYSEPENVIDEIRNSNCDIAKVYILQYANLKDTTLAGIYSELVSHLVLFVTDLEISNALQRENIITPEDLETGNIFIEIPEEKLEQWRPMLTICVNLFLKAFERREEGLQPILMLLDETPRLGKLRLCEALATLRSRKIHIMPIIQSVAQLDMIYGRDARKVITDNCPYKAVLGASDAETMEWISQMVGNYDKTIISYLHSQDDNKKSITVSEQERRIIKPQELSYMTDIILLNPINGFCRITKTPYYLEHH